MEQQLQISPSNIERVHLLLIQPPIELWECKWSIPGTGHAQFPLLAVKYFPKPNTEQEVKQFES